MIALTAILTAWFGATGVVAFVRRAVAATLVSAVGAATFSFLLVDSLAGRTSSTARETVLGVGVVFAVIVPALLVLSALADRLLGGGEEDVGDD